MNKLSKQEYQRILDFLFPIFFLVVLAVAWIYGVTVTFRNDLSLLPPNWIINIGIDMFGMIICLIIIYSCILEMSYTAVNKAFVELICAICLNLFWDMLAWNFDGVEGFQNIVRLVNTMYFLTGYLVQFHFWDYMEHELRLKTYSVFRYLNRITCVVWIIATVFNWKYHFFFDVSEDAVYQRGNLYLFCLLPTVVVFITVAIAVIRQKIPFIEKMTFLSYEFFPFCAVLFQTVNYGLSILYPFCLLGAFLVYSNIYTQRSRKIAEQQAKITEQNMSIMVSQIQPHFLYNTLTTISNLCSKDPESAEEATVLFSQYLRGNLDSLGKKEPVPFNAELNHVKIYLNLEQKRFGDHLKVLYDIKESHFSVPALSLQPIVENSVKHGICEKDEPGTVAILTRDEGDNYLIVIEDDGVGFDTSAPRKEDGRSHIGMQNTVERLHAMCGATVAVYSSPGNGCRTEIRIPKERKPSKRYVADSSQGK